MINFLYINNNINNLKINHEKLISLIDLLNLHFLAEVVSVYRALSSKCLHDHDTLEEIIITLTDQG